MKPRVNGDALMQEFKEGSIFFQKTPKAPPSPVSATSAQERTPSAGEPASFSDTMVPRHRDTTPDTMAPRHHNTDEDPQPLPARIANPLLERTRRAVKHLGKEAATHRFTVDEKKALMKIEHEYALKGIRTNENEITRIAINYMAEEYRQNKETSILAQVLDLLNN